MRYFISLIFSSSLTIVGSVMLTTPDKTTQATGTLLMIVGGVTTGVVGSIADRLEEQLKEIKQERSRNE